jgi:anti-anti-sigma regulatory factor
LKSPHASEGMCLAVELIANLALAWQLGCRVTLSGISSEVALTLTQQEIALSDIATVRSPQEALRLRQM